MIDRFHSFSFLFQPLEQAGRVFAALLAARAGGGVQNIAKRLAGWRGADSATRFGLLASGLPPALPVFSAIILGGCHEFTPS